MQAVFFITPEKETLYQYAQLSIPNNDLLIHTKNKKQGFDLYFDEDEQLTLRDTQQNKLQIHFDSGKTFHRLQFGGGKQQPLAKACGLNKQNNLQLLDATAGFAQDAFVLASLNQKGQTTLVEQHPALFSLIAFALNKKSGDEEVNNICKTMDIVNANSIKFMDEHPNTFDVVYLDPMYPERKKQAKVKKAMQVLHSIIGHEQDENALFNSAFKCTKKRVVIKRPKSAPFYANNKPNFSSNSKNTRYDVYLKP